MSHEMQSLSSKRPRFMAVLLLMAVAGILMLGHASGARAENKCTSGEFCAWTGNSYSGSEAFLSCPSNIGEGILIFTELRSAKNRCGSQYVQIGWYEGGSVSWKACMSPGGERPEPGRFNIYERVGSC